MTIQSLQKEVQVVEIRELKQRWGATWKMILEKWISKSGKSYSYLIYHSGGQSYPVGTFRSKKQALKVLNSFTEYK